MKLARSSKILIQLLLISVFMFSACEKLVDMADNYSGVADNYRINDDDDDNNNTTKDNKFSYKGIDYPIDEASVEYDREWNPGIHLFEIVFCSWDTYQEVYAGLTFTLVCSNGNAIETGTYNYFSGGAETPGVWGQGELDLLNVTPQVYLSIDRGGTIEIQKSGDNYTITINVTGEFGNPIIGYYYGNLLIH